MDKLPKLAEVEQRTIIDTKALGQFWKSERNLYYDKEKILSIEQLKDFARNGELILKRPGEEITPEDSMLPAIKPIGITVAYYEPTETFLDFIN